MWRKGLLSGVAWGAVVATAHLGHGIGLILALGQPPLTWFAAKGSIIEALIGVAMGVAFSPLFRLPRGEILHPVALTGAWLLMERIVAVDPSKPAMWLAPSLVALALYGLGALLWRRSPRAVVAIAVLLPLALLAAPEIRTRLNPEPEMLVERGTPRAGAPDVLFLVMDTVRAESTSAYGYGRKTTPNLDQLASEGILFEEATAPGTWSLPAHAALFTGNFPSYNNAHEETRYLDEKLPTVAETFAKAGYDTLCFSANPHVSDAFGLTRGFAYSDRAWMSGPGARQFSFIYRTLDWFDLGATDKGGGEVVGNVTRWLAHRPKDGPPAFVFVNFLEAHFPFHQLPHDYVYAFQDRPMSVLREAGQIAFGVQFGRQLTDDEQAKIRQPLVDLYDGGVLYTDHLIGEIVDLWREQGLLDNTVVVVLADHGEAVGEHGAFGHVTPLTEQILHVPLVFRYPPRIQGGERVTRPVSSVGTFATLTDLAGIEAPKDLAVGSLLAPGSGKPILAERFEEHMLAGRFAPGTANGTGPLVDPHGRYRVIRSGELKLIQHGADTWTLYDLATDPGENQDISQTRASDVSILREELETVRLATGLPELTAELGAQPHQIDDATRAQLEALGYLQPEPAPK
jgi:arylsulfatase A-like enzyme